MYFNLWLKTRKSILSKHEAEHFQTFQGASIWSETFPWALDLRSQTNTSSCVLSRDSNQQWFLIIQNIPQQWFSYLSFMNYQWVWGVTWQKNGTLLIPEIRSFGEDKIQRFSCKSSSLLFQWQVIQKHKFEGLLFFQNLTSMIIQNQQFRHVIMYIRSHRLISHS